MEDLLYLYADKLNDLVYEPKICFDEKPVCLLEDYLPSIPPKPNHLKKVDCQYIRQGTCNLFRFYYPQIGWRHLEVTERRTKKDFAYQMKNLVDVNFPDARKIQVILDNLNTHTFSALYEVFSPEEASRIMRRLEFYYTPKHGSWLNQIELEFSVLSRQCLNRRIGNIEELRFEIAAWEKERNQKRAKIDWRFQVNDAREKMGRLYPNITYHN